MVNIKNILKIFNGSISIPSLALFILTIILSIFNTNTIKDVDLADESLTIDTLLEGFTTMSQNTISVNVRNSKMCVYWKNSDDVTVFPEKVTVYLSIDDVKAVNNCPDNSTLKSDINEELLTTFIEIVPTMFGTSSSSTNKGISITLGVIACIALLLMTIFANKDNIEEGGKKVKGLMIKDKKPVDKKDDDKPDDQKINVNANGNGINVIVNISKKSDEIEAENNIEEASENSVKLDLDKIKKTEFESPVISPKEAKQKIEHKEHTSSNESIKKNRSRASIKNSPQRHSPQRLSPQRTNRNRSRSTSKQRDEPEFIDNPDAPQQQRRRLSLKNLPSNVSELTFNTNPDGNIDLELELKPENCTELLESMEGFANTSLDVDPEDMYTPRNNSLEENSEEKPNELNTEALLKLKKAFRESLAKK